MSVDLTGPTPICGHTRVDGKPCKAYCVRGTKGCHIHGGESNRPLLQAKTAIRHASQLSNTYGAAIWDVSPEEILLEEIARTYGHVKWLEEKILTEAPDDVAEAFFMYTRSTEVNGSYGVRDLKAIYSGVWLNLYLKERAHLANITTKALSIGIEARRVKLQETVAAQLATAINIMLKQLGKDPEDPGVRGIVQKALVMATTGEGFDMESLGDSRLDQDDG